MSNDAENKIYYHNCNKIFTIYLFKIILINIGTLSNLLFLTYNNNNNNNTIYEIYLFLISKNYSFSFLNIVRPISTDKIQK